MKRTTSFHLEEDILKEIEQYKKDYNLSSRNVAIERMIIERRSVIKLNEILLNKRTAEEIDAVENNIKEDVTLESNKIVKSVDGSYNDMPE